MSPRVPVTAASAPPALAFSSAGPTQVMGICNVTPDSFSDGGQCASPEQAVAHGRALSAAGAQWLDVGGESTRPGAPPVLLETELQRVLPALAALRTALPATQISVDTRRGAVAAAALAAGADAINDVSAGADPRLLEAVAAADGGLILMHMQGEPSTMQDAPSYRDVVQEVVDFLAQRCEQAQAAGVRREAIMIDPGIGFGKTVEHNVALLHSLEAIAAGVDRPLLLGVSRKSVLNTLCGPDLPWSERDHLSHVVHALVADRVAMIRCHDVSGAFRALTLARALARGCIV